ncbi:MAG TPA: hypothetical protein VIL55_11535 [Naasia sp.]
MPSIRFRLDRPTLAGLAERVRAEYGPGARVVATEESLSGGIGGFFAKRVIDVTVELPDPGVHAEGHKFDTPARVGLARLLDAAEQEEGGVLAAAEPPVSTESVDFARVLDSLRTGVGPGSPPHPAPAPPGADEFPRPVRLPFPPTGPVELPAPFLAAALRAAPPLLRGPGDLVIVAGLGDDAVRVAHGLAASASGRAFVCDGGSVSGNTRRRVEDRRSANAARAYGVQSGQPVIVAYGLGIGDPADPRISALPGIGGDQLWAAVDASRKTADTARWLNALRTRADVAALGVFSGRHTASPESVAELGVPQGWSDAVG